MFVIKNTLVRFCFPTDAMDAVLNGKTGTVVRNINVDGKVKQEVKVAWYDNGPRVGELVVCDNSCFTVINEPYLPEEVAKSIVLASIQRVDPEATVVSIDDQKVNFELQANAFFKHLIKEDDGMPAVDDEAHLTIRAEIMTDLNPVGTDGFQRGQDHLEAVDWCLMHNEELPRGERVKRSCVLSYTPLSTNGTAGWTLDYVTTCESLNDRIKHREQRITRFTELNAPDIIIAHEQVRLDILKHKQVQKINNLVDAIWSDEY